jgi:hypothetical protein
MEFGKTTLLAVVSLMTVTGCKHDFASLGTEDSSASPRLLAPIEFTDFSVTGPVSSQGANQLLNERVKIGSADADAYEFLVRDEGQAQKRVQVETVAAYLAARRSGAYPYTTFDLAMDSFFEQAGSALVFFQRALPAKTNLLDHASLLNLSVSFVQSPEEAGSERNARDVKNGLRLKDYARSHTIWGVHQTSPTKLQFTTGDMDYDVELLACGDYDHDGYEDGLLFVAAIHHEGSGRSYNAYLISCTNPTQAIPVQDFEFWH